MAGVERVPWANGRGFVTYGSESIECGYGSFISVSESSAADGAWLWLRMIGSDAPAAGATDWAGNARSQLDRADHPYQAAAHLSRAGVSELVARLQAWLTDHPADDMADAENMEPFLAIRRADGGGIGEYEFTFVTTAGPDDWSPIDGDVEWLTEQTTYQIVRMVPELVAERTWSGEMCAGCGLDTGSSKWINLDDGVPDGRLCESCGSATDEDGA